MDGGSAIESGGRRRRADRGASLVEFAFILPIFVVLIFGMITGGIALSQQNSVKNAVRETTRFGAIVANFPEAGGPHPPELGDLYDQVVNAATGDLDVGTDGRKICVAMIGASDKWWYEVYGTGAAPVQQGDDVAPASVPAACSDGFDGTVGVSTERIWVRVQRKAEIRAIFFDVPITLESHSLSRYER